MDERKNPQDLPPLELLNPGSPGRDFRENLRVVLGIGPRLKFTVPQDLPPLELLKPRSRYHDIRENLRVVLGLGPKPAFAAARTPQSDALTEITRGRFPVRGFLYSCVLHQVILILLLLIPPMIPAQRKRFEFDRWLPLDTKLIYTLPKLESPKKSGHEGGGKPGGKTGGGSPEKSNEAPAPAPKEGGLVYPAPIEAVSNPPRPNNFIQTILQPDLVNPPQLKTPIPLPNVVKIARGNPAPPPLVPKVEAKLDPPVIPEAPKLTLPPNIAKLLPKSLRTPPPPSLVPKVKKLPAERLPEAPELAMAAQPEMAKLLRTTAAPPPLIPKVNIVASSDPPVEEPRLPVETRAPGMVTLDRGHKTAAPPPLVPTVARVGIPAGHVPEAPTLQATPGAAGLPQSLALSGGSRGHGAAIPPLVPPIGAAGALAGGKAGGSGTATAAPNLALPPGAGGTDDRNLLVLSPIPGPPGSEGNLPFGESRGQFAMGPNPNLRGMPGLPPGSGDGIAGGTGSGPADSKGTGAGGTGAGGLGSGPDGGVKGEGGGGGGGTGKGTGPGAGDGVGPGSGSGSGTGGGGTGPGTGTGTGSGPGQGSGTGSGTGPGSGHGSGSGSGTNPFPGIYIAGVTGTTGVVGGSRGAAHQTVPAGPKTTYGMTIVSTASSGGGLRDFGIFRNEIVSTVYIEMTHSPTPAPSWTLQYALLQKNPDVAPDRLVGPFPIDKEKPQFPHEVVERNLGRLVIVYAEINDEGKVVNSRIIQSPNPLLNSPLLEALAKWAFRPAESAGKPVAVKALLGIPLSLPPG